MLSTLEARRIALAAQGFGKARPNRARRIAPLQLDFVNVLVPAHYLLLYGHGGFTEQWAHEAAVIPVETWPLLKHRMAEHTARPAGLNRCFRITGLMRTWC